MRISKRRQVFEKGYVAGWSEEIFIVTDRFPTTPVTYAIKDLADEQIKGRFYKPELPGREGETAKLNITSSGNAIGQV